MPVNTRIQLSSTLPVQGLPNRLVWIGRRGALTGLALPPELGLTPETWDAMLQSVEPGDRGASTSTWVGQRELVMGVLPEECSRHNSPARSWAIPKLAARALGRQDALLVFALSDPSHAQATALAAARAFPRYQGRTGAVHDQTVTMVLPGAEGLDAIEAGVEAIREAGRLVDMPTAELHTDAFVAEALAVAERVGATVTLVQGTALRDQGLGGLWGVGKAATHLPALVALHHRPAGATRKVAWVGKGIVYDTGGLSIKGKDHMPGMKGDMGGAAAVLAAFEAAVRGGFPAELTAVLCLAENSVGPESMRPDDILQMRSGKTVEVNNTDAEGRLVLADGVAWVCATEGPDLVVDLATLTGAALVATGKTHAAICSNDEEVESVAVLAGLRAGEPVHPLLFAPELFRGEFKSEVADMKNSVKDRANAQTSCAAQFIANHLPDPAPRWLHVDIAGPAWGEDGRGTGYGVGFLLSFGAGPSPA